MTLKQRYRAPFFTGRDRSYTGPNGSRYFSLSVCEILQGYVLLEAIGQNVQKYN